MRERHLPAQLKLPEKDARDVLRAELLETSPRTDSIWSEADAAAATRDARHLAGEDAAPAGLLALRARLVLARLRERGAPAVPSDADGTAAARVLTALLAAIAYFAGVMTDRLAASGSVVNLLSPPLVAFLLWNLLVYTLLLSRPAIRLLGSTFEPPLRGALAKALETLRWRGLKPDALKRTYLARWSALAGRKYLLLSARALHLAAFAFAVGIITSIVVRGIGTAYTVGWESTWLADRPETVLAILDAVYGFASFGTPMPDLDTVSGMNLAAGAPAAQDASVWLLRLMSLVALVVLLPRALLAAAATLRLKRLASHLPYPVTTPYYKRILLAPEEACTQEGILLEAGSETTPRWEAFRAQLERALPGLRVRSLAGRIWEQSPAEIACEASALGAAERRFWAALDASSTPEDEVHGRLLAELPRPVEVLLDVSSLLERFGPEAPNVRSRIALWETFCHERGVSCRIVDLSDEASQRSAVASLAQSAS